MSLYERITRMISGCYIAVRNAVRDCFNGPDLNDGIPMEPVDDGQAGNIGQGPQGVPGQGPGTGSSTGSFNGGDPESGEAAPNSNRMNGWTMVLIAGGLSLIVVPGLVLGVVTGQVMWGFALSSAIAAVAGVLVALYQHREG